MVRRRVEMKKIENKSSRQVAFSKRRKGLLKKSQDLSVLCDADVAVIVFSNRGRLYDYCTAPRGLLEKYVDCVEAQDTKSTCEAETCMGSYYWRFLLNLLGSVSDRKAR